MRNRKVCQPGDMGLDMTIGVAAITDDQKYIVVASDMMLSSGDFLPPADNAALKTRAIARGWGVTFAASDANLFRPLLRRSLARIHGPTGIKKSVDEKTVLSGIEQAYREIFDEQFTAKFLSQLGYSSVGDFRAKGLAELGPDVFRDRLNDMAKFDLGVSFLVYGFDGDAPRLFEATNPGIITDHNLLRYAVIGSGFFLATASLRRRPPRGNLESTIYRVLEAKFLAESATGVGLSTSLLVMNGKGQFNFLGQKQLDGIKETWRKTLTQPDPEEALKIIEGSDVTSSMRDFDKVIAGPKKSRTRTKSAKAGK